MSMQRTRRSTRLIRPALAGAWLALLPAAQVFAQAAPTPSVTRSPYVVLGYIIVFVLLVMVIAVSLMPSKRSHQD